MFSKLEEETRKNKENMICEHSGLFKWPKKEQYKANFLENKMSRESINCSLGRAG